MSKQTLTSEQYRDDEIDLRKLFQAIGNGFSNLGKGFVNIIIRIRRASIQYKFLLIAMIIGGGIAGVAFNKITKPVYKTSMLLSSEYFNARLVDNSLEKLNALCEEKDRVGLANLLNIEVEIAMNIQKFDYEPLVSEQDKVEVEILKQKLEEFKIKDADISRVINQIEIQNKDSYIISVHVFDIKIIGNLQDALVNYFKSTPFVKNRIKINKEKQTKYIAKLKSDISQLDSLKQAFNLNLKANAGRKGESSNNVYVGESGSVEPTSVYSQGVSLYRQLQQTERDLELGSDFEVIDGFTVFSKPESASLIKASVLSSLIFLGLAYVLIILLEINKYLNRIEKERFDLDKQA